MIGPFAARDCVVCANVFAPPKGNSSADAARRTTCSRKCTYAAKARGLYLPRPEPTQGQAAHRPWSASELDRLRAVYRHEATPFITIKQLAEELGREEGNLSRKARELGLANPHRKRVEKRVVQERKFATDDERREWQSQDAKRRIADLGHPRGMAGKHHPESAKARISAASRARWADPASRENSDEVRQAMSDNMQRRVLTDPRLRHGYSRSAGGRRADLDNAYFRSSWEANYARYLRFLVGQSQIRAWEYEPHTFYFESIKRGTRSYTPDFRVTLPDGRVEWHEVKGWMDDKSRVRLARMAKFYPAEKIVLIDEKWFRSANRGGLAAVIPGWEKKRRAESTVLP
jgi:hypothetical protein